jgi:hypothetical protein
MAQTTPQNGFFTPRIRGGIFISLYWKLLYVNYKRTTEHAKTSAY